MEENGVWRRTVAGTYCRHNVHCIENSPREADTCISTPWNNKSKNSKKCTFSAIHAFRESRCVGAPDKQSWRADKLWTTSTWPRSWVAHWHFISEPIVIEEFATKKRVNKMAAGIVHNKNLLNSIFTNDRKKIIGDYRDMPCDVHWFSIFILLPIQPMFFLIICLMPPRKNTSIMIYPYIIRLTKIYFCHLVIIHRKSMIYSPLFHLKWNKNSVIELDYEVKKRFIFKESNHLICYRVVIDKVKILFFFFYLYLLKIVIFFFSNALECVNKVGRTLP